jgi:hypothetical protein
MALLRVWIMVVERAVRWEYLMAVWMDVMTAAQKVGQ